VKTNAARLLDTLGIKYELRDYEVDLEDLSAETVAAKVGLPPEQVFKTLVARGDRTGVVMAVVAADADLAGCRVRSEEHFAGRHVRGGDAQRLPR
jgi:Cys-tRNA(Pro)/Cys-tRNA(Cys) deacylase